MIRIDRPPEGPPDIFGRGGLAERALAKLSTRVKAGAQPEFESRVWAAAKEHLQALFHGKCAFCESAYSRVAYGDVTHFRPKRLRSQQDKEAEPGPYWWLAYEWRNLYPSCQRCDQVSGRREFPIAGERAKPNARGADLAAEHPLLVDPCIDQPGEHLRFSEEGFAFGVTQRGEATIMHFHLNREELIEGRHRAADTVRQEFLMAVMKGEAGPTFWSQAYDPSREFAAARQQAAERLMERVLSRT